MRSILVVVLAASFAAAETGKIVEASPYAARTDVSLTAMYGYPNPAASQRSWGMFTLTVTLDGTEYRATFRTRHDFRASDFVVGDAVEATVEGDNLRVTRANGKTEKAKITWKARM